jgi:hypothetical protein
MSTELNLASYNDLKAHYIAVRRRLGGLGKPAGLVPISAIKSPPVKVEVDKQEKPEIVFKVDGIPRNGFYEMLMDIARKHEMDPKLIINPDRRKNVVKVRRELVWRAVNEQKYSASQVSRWLKRDHTTILNDLYCWERDNGIGA